MLDLCLLLEDRKVGSELLVARLVHLICVFVHLRVLSVVVFGVEEDGQAVELKLLRTLKVRGHPSLNGRKAQRILDLAQVLLALRSAELLRLQPELVEEVAVLVFFFEVCDQLGYEVEPLGPPATLARVLELGFALEELALDLVV